MNRLTNRVLKLAAVAVACGFVTVVQAESDRIALVGLPTGFLVEVGPGPARNLYVAAGDRDYGTADAEAWPVITSAGSVAASADRTFVKVGFPEGWGRTVKRLRVFTTELNAVEYIYSTDNGLVSAQQIDTGIKPDDRTKVEIDIQIEPHKGIASEGGAYSRPYGAGDDWNVRYNCAVGHDCNILFAWPYSKSQATGIIFSSPAIWAPNRFLIVQDRTGLFVSNKTERTSFRKTTFNSGACAAPKADGSVQVSRSMYLFGHNMNGDYRNGPVCRLYSCTISTGATETVARDFVPIEKDGKGALYDRVTGECFSDINGVGFGAGPRLSVAAGGICEWSASVRSDKVGLSIDAEECLLESAAEVGNQRMYPGFPDAGHARVTRQLESVPSLAINPANGRMWATWYGGITAAEDRNNYVILATSLDGGLSWSEVAVADPDGSGPLRAFDPEVWVDDDAVLHWSWTEGVDQEVPTLRLMEVRISADSVPSAYPAARAIGKGVMMCKPTKLADGRVLYPVANWKSAPSANFYVMSAAGTLEMVGGVTIPSADRLFDEHIMIQRGDGSLYALIRGAGNASALYESESSDGGITWTAGSASSLGHPSARLFMRRLASGNLLLVKHGDIGETTSSRTKLKAFLSDDDGATWKGGLLLDAGADVSYPDGDQAPDGTVHIIYDQSRTGARSIWRAAFTEADVLAGENVSGKVELRQDVHRATDFPKDASRVITPKGAVSDFQVVIGPGKARQLFMVYGSRDYGTADWSAWPHCIFLDEVAESSTTVTNAYPLPDGWGERVDSFRILAAPDVGIAAEYIYSTCAYGGDVSAQQIDTGIRPDDRTKVEIDVQIESHTGVRSGSGAFSRLYGAGDDWNVRYNCAVGHDCDVLFAWPYSKSQATGILFSSPAIWAPNRFVIVQDRMGLFVSNKTECTSFRKTAFNNGACATPKADGSVKVSRNMYLFGHNMNGDYRNGTVCRLYSCTISTGVTETVARDFVPVEKEGKGALYDRVTGECFSDINGVGFGVGPLLSERPVPHSVCGWGPLCEALPKNEAFMILLR